MPDLQQTKNAELKASFIRLLPKRLGIIEQECHSLCHEAWEMGALGDFYDEIQHLAGSAGNFGLLEISDRLFSIEVYLASFVDSGIAPTAEQIGQIERLTDDLMKTARRSVPEAFSEHQDSESGEAPSEQSQPAQDQGAAAEAKAASAPESPVRSGKKRIGLLGLDDSPIQRLLMNLEQSGDAGETLEMSLQRDKWDFITAVERGSFDAVIVDTASLDESGKVGEAIRFLRQQRKQNLPALFVSADSSLSARLAAMRSGADAFLAEPRDTGVILQRLQDVMAVEDQHPFQVLIVEDDRSQAIFCESILRKAGMTTRSVGEPLKAIEALNDFHPDVILMDLHMPACDGAELTALIRERPDYVSTPIVFLSGEKDKDRHLDALAHGGDDFLSKPIRPRHLISAVTIRARRARDLRERLDRGQVQQRDTVSGMHERGYLLDAINQACDSQDGGEALAGLLFIRLDQADTLREKAGFMGLDDILSQLATTIASAAGPSDVCARMTDTTFVMMRQSKDPAAINAFAERLCHQIAEQPFDAGDTQLMATVSVGVCPITGRSDAAQLLNRAERAAATVAKEGGNAVGLALPAERNDRTGGDAELKQQRLELLKQAIEADTLQILYQPLVSLNDQSTEQYQTLLRLRDDSTGQLLTAGDLIPLAIEHQLIAEVDRFVLDHALAVLGDHHRRGKKVRLFVSHSANSLLEPGRTAWIFEKMRVRQIDPDYLVIELPYPGLAENRDPLVAKIRELADEGLRVSLSNFNGGQEAFDLLQDLPVHYLKAGAQLVEELTDSSATSERFNAMVESAHEQNRLVVAPMIENAASVIPLWASGVDFIQGHFVQRPDSNLQFDFAASSF